MMTPVRRLVLSLLLVFPLLSVSAEAGLPPLPSMLAERELGNPQAKVTMIEYSSFTCPHCADFHRDTLPQIKQAYIDTGLVRYVMREFPLDRRAMAAAMIARCVPVDRYFAFIQLVYLDQQTWARSADPLADLKLRAQLAGLSPGDVDACLDNKALLDGIQARATEAQQRDQIQSTPTFLINGTKISGAQPFAAYKTAIEEALAKAR
jgi:protein-disulfide isomerase